MVVIRVCLYGQDIIYFSSEYGWTENYGGRYGNCHLAAGNSYADTFDGDPAKLTKERKKKLGFNDSALHWDLVNTEKKRVRAYLKNGKKTVVYENGMFKY